ncbi:MAG: BatA domain-containing protein, partial [Aggregatilineales bacterium]
MLRLRRREAVVSSHFLWQRALKDYAANTPWQRLRRHLLLLLQLLALALLVVALARPALPGSTPSLGRVVVLLDASASMQTVEADGQTRWALALEQARQLVDELG